MKFSCLCGRVRVYNLYEPRGNNKGSEGGRWQVYVWLNYICVFVCSTNELTSCRIIFAYWPFGFFLTSCSLYYLILVNELIFFYKKNFVRPFVVRSEFFEVVWRKMTCLVAFVTLTKIPSLYQRNVMWEEPWAVQDIMNSSLSRMMSRWLTLTLWNRTEQKAGCYFTENYPERNRGSLPSICLVWFVRRNKIQTHWTVQSSSFPIQIQRTPLMSQGY